MFVGTHLLHQGSQEFVALPSRKQMILATNLTLSPVSRTDSTLFFMMNFSYFARQSESP
jgi:hypothetical protein